MLDPATSNALVDGYAANSGGLTVAMSSLRSETLVIIVCAFIGIQVVV